MCKIFLPALILHNFVGITTNNHLEAVAGALEVSTTVDILKFNKVLKWLITEKMIPEYSIDESRYTKSQKWFIRN